MEERNPIPTLKRTTPGRLWWWLVPLVLLFVAVDVGLWLVISLNKIGPFKSPAQFLLAGALIGQFGLCCALRLRFESKRWWAYAGMIVLVIAAIFLVSVTVPITNRRQAVVATAMGATFLAIYCHVPIALQRGYYRVNKARQFTIGHLIGACVVAASLFSVSAKLDTIIPLAIAVFVAGLPTIVATMSLARDDFSDKYNANLMASMLVLIAILVCIGPIYTIFPMLLVAAQGACLWLGGLVLRTAPSEYSAKEVQGLPKSISDLPVEEEGWKEKSR